MSEEQTTLGFNNNQPITSVDKYEFEPIKGYPMLIWKGKRPFTSTQYYPAQLKEVHGPEVDGWRNKIYWGDNLQVLSHLLKDFRGKIRLVYIDPPFDSKASYRKIIEIKNKTINGNYSSFEEKQYEDIWNNDEFLQNIYERLILIRELLAEDGSIYLHVDWHRGHYIRCIMDEIFGADRFQNEIIWYYYNKMQGNINRFASNHDVIYWYSKGEYITFNKIREDRDEPVKQIKRVWDKEKQKLVNAKDSNGKVIYIEATQKTIDDVWRISMLQPADKTENLRYPTQKPEALLERIIKASSNPGDLILDCFMGSGTTQSVAMKLGRHFIGVDINLGAVQTTTKRLLKITDEIEKKIIQTKMDIFEESPHSFYAGFEVYNVNNYDVFRNPVEAKDLLLEAVEVQRLEAGNLFDGEKDGRMVKVMPVNRIATRADLSELIAGFDYKAFDRRQAENPNKPVEKITLVCMGHEPDLAAVLESEAKPYKIDVEVVDILRDKQDLQFKRDSEAQVAIKDDHIIIEKFYPMNLLQKLSIQQESLSNWRELVESVMIDWNYDGAIFTPALVDIPDKNELVKGKYLIPKDAGTIRVKITDLLSESLETDVHYG